MKLNEKIALLRRQNEWSQEELAERLDVSRQAVSKWEGGQSTPELNNVVQMCELFGVSADVMLRDDLGLPGEENPHHSDLPVLTLKDTYDYIAQYQTVAHRIGLGVMLCILSPVPIIALTTWLGLSALFLLVAWAVWTFITTGPLTARFRYVQRGNFHPAPGVIEWIRKSREELRPAMSRDVAAGVTLCVFSPAAIFPFQDTSFASFGVALMLAIIAFAVYLLVRSAIKSGCYHRLLKGKS